MDNPTVSGGDCVNNPTVSGGDCGDNPLLYLEEVL